MPEPRHPSVEGVDAASLGDVTQIQRRTVRILAAGQVLGGIAFGATVSLGALLAADISGQDALSGLATASVTLGASLCAIPLARLASKRGRRFALTLGNLLALVGIAVVLVAAASRIFPLLLVGVILIGAGNAGNLQSRFAATDLARSERRARDLGTVVWATTIGGVVGPLMLTPGEALGQAIGMPPLTGAYAFSIVAQIGAFVLYIIALRPDPLLVAQHLARGQAAHAHIVEADRPIAARYAIFAVTGSHVVMASVMAMTPVHLAHLDPTHVTTIVGFTIALHVFGMYGLSPLFGMLADRWGRVRVILLGQGLLVGALLVAALASHSQWAVLVALLLLGLGWSAATVSGAALLTESTLTAMRPRRQGLSDTIMTFSAAVGAVLAGFILGWIGYGGLALVALVVVIAVTVLSPYARRGARVDAAAVTIEPDAARDQN
ncbi:MFS transporter [Microbacterium invictum]|uniref:MFS family permease n=1 Tax=Microbacterium invictum TaxID=515415 RepID=A0AA40SMB5_9MICO|nr:MFS transporter [Microbacterium invictum]MBB4138868.1 MFS family permease [Microbacterium invictum]